jgi:serine/threonine protein kinase
MASEGGVTATSDVFALVGRVLHERVRVDRVVAEGGFGVVYEGEHLALGVKVAVKVLKPDEDDPGAQERFVAQFVREARTIARVRHPNIVQVLDVARLDTGVEQPLAYMVLEWCDGDTLERWLELRGEEHRALTPKAAWELLRPVALAIATAHEHGVVHRDLKPGNIMIVTSGKKRPVPMLLDFGIAKVMEADAHPGSGVTATDSTFRAFSPRYAAPEQVAGTRTGPWTDVHALGLLFVELVLGTTAYKSDSRQWLLQEIMSPARPTVVHRGLSLGPMDDVLAKALAFLPDERFADATAFIAAMDEVLASGKVPEVSGAEAAKVRLGGAPTEVKPDEKPAQLPARVATEHTLDMPPDGRSDAVSGPLKPVGPPQAPVAAKPNEPIAPANPVDSLSPAATRGAPRWKSSTLAGAAALALLATVSAIASRTARSEQSGSSQQPQVAHDAAAAAASNAVVAADAGALAAVANTQDPAAQTIASEDAHASSAAIEPVDASAAPLALLPTDAGARPARGPSGRVPASRGPRGGYRLE